MSTVDLQNLIPGCKNFYWHEVLWLDKWALYAHPVGQQHLNLVRMCNKAETIRQATGNRPIIITSALRPPYYNSFVGGAYDSAHRLGRALDFVVSGMSAEDARLLILPHLETLSIRMHRSNDNFIHIDDYPPSDNGRYFT